MADAIATHDLTKRYGKHRGIERLNLQVRRGEIFGFLGPNGAGKSTTLRVLLGFLRPTSGSAQVLGIDLRGDIRAIHARTGILPGEFALDDRMTARHLIELFARLRNVRDLSYAHELAERFDADLERPMRRLSRGNKQKIGLIQAMFHRPELLVFDEPTAGLDPLIQETFLDILTESRERGQTVFFSSHILPEVERVADRVGIIREGELVAVEDPKQLTGRSFRHYRVEFVESLPAASLTLLSSLHGVRDVVSRGAVVTFTAASSADEIVKLIARHRVEAIEIEHPTLEEVFLRFYSEPAVEAVP